MPFIYRYYSIQIISYVYLFVRGPERLWWSFFFYSVAIIIFSCILWTRGIWHVEMFPWFDLGAGGPFLSHFLGTNCYIFCYVRLPLPLSVSLWLLYQFSIFHMTFFFFYHNAFTKPFILRCYFSSLARRLWCTNIIQILKYQLKILQ